MKVTAYNILMDLLTQRIIDTKTENYTKDQNKQFMLGAINVFLNLNVLTPNESEAFYRHYIIPEINKCLPIKRRKLNEL